MAKSSDPGALKAATRLERFPESKSIFLKNGEYFEMDDFLVQPELARTLARIQQHGAADFYEGETARLLVNLLSDPGVRPRCIDSAASTMCFRWVLFSWSRPSRRSCSAALRTSL